MELFVVSSSLTIKVSLNKNTKQGSIDENVAGLQVPIS